MTEREALNLALEALKHTHPSALTSFYTIGDRDKAIKAIQEHLAQPEQEPVACPYCKYSTTLGKVYYDQNCFGCVKRMTTTPEPLTDEEIEKKCPKFEDPMRREMWMIGFKAAHGIKGEA